MKTIFLLIFISTISIFAKWEYFSSEIVNWYYMPNTKNAYIDSKNNIWIYREGDLFRYDGNNWKKFAFNESGIKDGINCISEDKNGNIWVGTDFNEELNNDKIFRIEGDSLIPFKIGKTSSDIYFEDVKGLFFDENNDLWVITNRSIYQYNEESKYWSINLIYNLKTEEGFSINLGDYNEIGNTINYDNNILIFIKKLSSFGSVRGIFDLQIKNKELNLSFIKNPFGNQIGISFINVDSTNNFWSWNELGPINYKKNEWVRMDYHDTNFIKDISLSCIDKENKKCFSHVIDYEDGKFSNIMYYRYNDIGFELLFEQNNLQKDFNESINREDLILARLLFIDKNDNYWFYLNQNRGIAKYTPEGASVKDKITISIFPNPALNTVTINSEEPIKSLGLYSLNLSKISDFTPNHTTTQDIDISNLASGVYFIKVNDDFIKFVRE